jgi:hypothetical protein
MEYLRIKENIALKTRWTKAGGIQRSEGKPEARIETQRSEEKR